jgi:S-adenosylmethionine decarboxylase
LAVHTVGRHLIIELFSCDSERLNCIPTITAALRGAAEAIGATIVSEAFHQYAPQGVSGVLLIAESHMSVHTWPEAGYVALDIYTCGDLDPRPAARLIGQSLGAAQCRLQETVRGLPEHIAAARALLPDDIVIVDDKPVEEIPLDGRSQSAVTISDRALS